MAMMFHQPLFIGIHLLITSQISYSLVLLSANIEDVRKLAMQFVPAPLADQIADFIAKATNLKSSDVLGKNGVDEGIAKLSYVNWADTEQRGILETSDEEKFRNHISVKRGRDVSNPDKETSTPPDIITKPFLLRKENFVYDYALKQKQMKQPKFEWQKGANYEIAALTNQGPLLDTTATYIPKETTISSIKIISDAGKAVKQLKEWHAKLEERNPTIDKIQQNAPKLKTNGQRSTKENVRAIKEYRHRPTTEEYTTVLKLNRPAKKKTYSNAEVHRGKSYPKIIKEVRKPVKEYPIYKEVRKPSTKENHIKVKMIKATTPEIKEDTKEENVVDSDDEMKINKIEIETDSSDSDLSETFRFTKDDYTDKERKAKTVKYQSEKSIYTKDVLATSGPVELLRASVDFIVSSEENSLNKENNEFFKQYDGDGRSRPDLRRTINEKSDNDETTTTTPSDDTNTDSGMNEDKPLNTESTPIQADADKNTKTSWYGGATVYNNVPTEQVTEGEKKEEEKKEEKKEEEKKEK